MNMETSLLKSLTYCVSFPQMKKREKDEETSSPACGRGKGPAERERSGIGEGKVRACIPLTYPIRLRCASPDGSPSSPASRARTLEFHGIRRFA
jgi:hypothetical protein